jgi:hypothetical protein
MGKTAQNLEKALQDGMEVSSDKFLYFNSFVVSVTPHDVLIVLQHNNQPISVLNTSHVIAKTLVKKLESLLETFEEASDSRIPTLDEIQEKIEGRKNANSK